MNHRPKGAYMLMFGGSFESHLGGTSYTEAKAGTFGEENLHVLTGLTFLTRLAGFINDSEHPFEDLRDVKIRRIDQHRILGLF